VLQLFEMSSTPKYEDNNWMRFTDDSTEINEEIEDEEDVDDLDSQDYQPYSQYSEY